jgi:hypothetical protein
MQVLMEAQLKLTFCSQTKMPLQRAPIFIASRDAQAVRTGYLHDRFNPLADPISFNQSISCFSLQMTNFPQTSNAPSTH